jgi:hypothetical protein
MAVITIGTTGASWGLTAETGLLVQTFSQKTTREKNQVRNEAGDFALVAYYNPTQAVSVSGVIIGATGASAAQPGVALTLTNATTGSNGSPTGGLYVDDIEISASNTDFKKFTANATRMTIA